MNHQRVEGDLKQSRPVPWLNITLTHNHNTTNKKLDTTQTNNIDDDPTDTNKTSNLQKERKHTKTSPKKRRTEDLQRRHKLETSRQTRTKSKVSYRSTSYDPSLKHNSGASTNQRPETQPPKRNPQTTVGVGLENNFHNHRRRRRGQIWKGWYENRKTPSTPRPKNNFFQHHRRWRRVQIWKKGSAEDQRRSSHYQHNLLHLVRLGLD